VEQVRILLVDDYRDALEMWGVYLRALGYEVLTAADGLDAVTMSSEYLPDLIVLDLDLPGISGLEAARRIRQEQSTAHIPLIAATGVSNTHDLIDARRAGFDAVLIKPCEPSALLRQIEHSLEGARQRAGAASHPANSPESA
jgi:CheY-like chemotaxis protein